MSGEPTIYVDFNRRDPKVAGRFYASLHRFEEPELGSMVRATDFDEFDVEARISAIDYYDGVVILDIEDAVSRQDHAAAEVKVFGRSEEDGDRVHLTSDHLDLESLPV